MSKSARRFQQGNGHEPKSKWEENRLENFNKNPIKPLNHKQRNYMELLNNKSIVIATGHPGTSKTYLAVGMACDLLRARQINQIVICRPNISNSPSLGAFKGTMEEKMEQWLTPVLNVIKERLGQGGYEVAVKNEKIVYQPLETIKGLSLKDAWLIVDEAEDVSIDDMKKIITRTGENCKLVLAGDVSQSELKENSGLTWFRRMVERQDLDDIVGIIDFNSIEDIVRSKTTKRIVQAMLNENKINNTPKLERIVSY